MSKKLGYNEIGYVAATFEVDATTQAYLKANYLDAATGKVDVNGKNLCVCLTGDNKVGFGVSSPTAANAILGVMIAYEQDGYATIMISGCLEEVPASAAIAVGHKSIVVNNTGKISALEPTVSDSSLTAGGKAIDIIKAATSSDLYATIKI